MAAPYVQARTKRRLRCPHQPDPRPDPNPNPNPTLWGALGLLSRSAGAVLSLRALLKTLHVRAIKRLVGIMTVEQGAKQCTTEALVWSGGWISIGDMLCAFFRAIRCTFFRVALCFLRCHTVIYSRNTPYVHPNKADLEKKENALPDGQSLRLGINQKKNGGGGSLQR